MAWTLERAQQVLGCVASDDNMDIKIQSAMDASLLIAEAHCNRKFLAASVTEIYYDQVFRAIHLERFPVTVITSISLQQTYRVDMVRGVIRIPSGPYLEKVTVEYTGGYAPNALPADLELALWEIFTAVWELSYSDNSQEVKLGAIKKQTIVGVGSVEYETNAGSETANELIPISAKNVLDTYLRPAV